MKLILCLLVSIAAAYSIKYKELLRCITSVRGSSGNFPLASYIMQEVMRNHFPNEPANRPQNLLRLGFISWFGDPSPSLQVKHLKDLMEINSEAMTSSAINYSNIPKNDLKVPDEILQVLPKEKSRETFNVLVNIREFFFEDIRIGYLDETFQKDRWVVSGMLHAVEAWNEFLKYRITLSPDTNKLLHLGTDIKDFQTKLSFFLDAMDKVNPLLFQFKFGFNIDPIVAILYLFIYLQMASRINSVEESILERIKRQHLKFYIDLEQFTKKCIESRTLIGREKIAAWNCENVDIYPITTPPEVIKNYRFCERLSSITLYKVQLDRKYLKNFIKLGLLEPKQEFVSFCYKKADKKPKKSIITYQLIINTTDANMDQKSFVKLTEILRHRKVSISDLGSLYSSKFWNCD